MTPGGSFLAAAAMWSVMMAAMMMPATMPWLLALGRLAPAGGDPGGSSGSAGLTGLLGSAVALFATGYVAVWAAFSVAAAGLQTWLQSAGLLTEDLALAGPLGGVLLLSAGAYQATPAKAACLRKCRNPMSFFLSHWRDGPVGSVRMGLEHGLVCLGCCWALMLLAFALGVMSLGWMAVLTAVVTVEKLAPGGQRIARIAGGVLMTWGVVLLVLAA